MLYSSLSSTSSLYQSLKQADRRTSICCVLFSLEHWAWKLYCMRTDSLWSLTLIFWFMRTSIHYETPLNIPRLLTGIQVGTSVTSWGCGHDQDCSRNLEWRHHFGWVCSPLRQRTARYPNRDPGWVKITSSPTSGWWGTTLTIYYSKEKVMLMMLLWKTTVRFGLVLSGFLNFTCLSVHHAMPLFIRGIWIFVPFGSK